MENKSKTVILEVEGTALECDKSLLIKNSDYFSAMFTGNFKESSLQTIKIQGVDLKSFNAILMLLWDRDYIIEEEEIHLILQTACMLQFDAIKQLCESRILEILKPSICLKIWKTAESLALSPLWIKAKCMALEEFSNICDSNQILEYSIDDLCLYLGHSYLNVNKSDMLVFQTAMNWWYEHQELYNKEDCTKVILRLLNCIDFKTLHINEIYEMKSYPDIIDNGEVVSVLNCVIDLKANGINIQGDYSEEQLINAIHLCNAKSRLRPGLPCILQYNWTSNPCPPKMLRCSEVFDRIVYTYDPLANKFRNIFLIDGDKAKYLSGFKVLSYKEFVFLYGGEFLLGAGNWNCNFWTYNTIKEKWERRNMLPHGRRHFETVIVDDCIYIIGGIGKFRVIQDNLFWYDFKADKWSCLIPLPSEGNCIKCCSYHGQLFVIYMAEKRAYFFNKELLSWRRVNIIIEKEIVDDLAAFAVFSDSTYFYIKGRFLIKFKLDGENLVPIKQTSLKEVEYEDIESVLCNATVYTLYKCLDERYNYFHTFESYNLETDARYYIFKGKIQENGTLEVDNKHFWVLHYTNLFSFNYYCLVKENICINEPFV